MPRPSNAVVDQYKDEIIELYLSGLSVPQLIEHLQQYYNIDIPNRTLKRRLTQWDIHKLLWSDEESAIKARIFVLLFNVGLEDVDILKALHQEGHNIGKWTLKRLRLTEGWKRRPAKYEDIREADAEIQRLVEGELQKGTIEGYGRGHLYTHFRQQGLIIARCVWMFIYYIFINSSSDRLFRAYHTVNPTAVDRRRHNLQRRRAEYIVQGPNFIWLIDGYIKLAERGIEIYASSIHTRDTLSGPT